MECGLSEKDAFHMTFGAVKRHIDAYWKRRKNEWERTEYQAWLIGAYTMNAIAAAFSKKAKYPNNPLEQNKPVDVSNLNEEQLADMQEKYLLQLDFMARSYKKKEADEQ